MKIISRIKESIGNAIAGLMTSVADFIHKYVLEMIILAFIFMGLCWAIGYFANALYGMHFELQSCWGGFTAIGGAGVLAAVKYCMDSWKNTPEGVAPDYDRRTIREKTTAQKMADITSDLLKNYADQGEPAGKNMPSERQEPYETNNIK